MKSFKDKLEEQTKYYDFFMAKLKKFGVKSPASLNAEEKKKFFSEIKNEWSKEKTK